VDDIDYARSDAKYTVLALRSEAGQPAEALLRTPLKDLAAQLDPSQFVRIHRSVIVNRRAISHLRRRDNETADLHLKGRKEVLPVSRSYLHLFKQM
jgi:DNA-binding LytR/AlgR family response regulator